MAQTEGSLNGFLNIRIGEVLKEYGYVDDNQIAEALAYQKKHENVRLGNAMIALGYITERQMLTALAHRLGLEKVDFQNLTVDIDAVGKIPEKMSVRYQMLAIRVCENVLYVLTNDPLNFYGLEDIRQTTGMDLEVMLAEEQSLKEAISYYYAEIRAKNAALRANQEQKEIRQAEAAALIEQDDRTPVIHLLNTLIERAYYADASDIHVEPFEKHIAIRMRIDGAIEEFVKLNKNLHASLVTRIKILGDMDIAERRIPQDGHLRIRVGEEMVNIRISILPTVFGEKAVIRLLSGNSKIEHLQTYGMSDLDYEKVKRMLALPNGLVYITGPTGCGKTTTLYMILQDLSKRMVNISTIEDPVEKNLENINQCQVNERAGMTFEVGLRALLRQDPDILMVGETRDAQTASISVRAAITGHLVLSTLHTNDAASAIIRLEDMGVEPYLIANSVAGIVAQRLMRKLCPDCCREEETNEQICEYLGRNIPKIRRAVGCAGCRYTGYHGRIAIHEVLFVDKRIRKMISKGADVEEIREYAIRQQGMVTLKESGVRLVLSGVTTLEELVKVTGYE